MDYFEYRRIKTVRYWTLFIGSIVAIGVIGLQLDWNWWAVVVESLAGATVITVIAEIIGD